MAVCENDKKEGTDEQCDGNDLAGKTCTDFNNPVGKEYGSGTLKCASCKFDTSECKIKLAGFCGDYEIDGNEKCDKDTFPSATPNCVAYDSNKYSGGSLTCSSIDCKTILFTNCMLKTISDECSDDSDCPSDFVCDTSSTPKKCIPKDVDTSCIDTDNDGYCKNKIDDRQVDCDDTNSGINPNAKEICGNGKDDDCDGEVDEKADCKPEAEVKEITDRTTEFNLFSVVIPKRVIAKLVYDNKPCQTASTACANPPSSITEITFILNSQTTLMQDDMRKEVGNMIFTRDDNSPYLFAFIKDNDKVVIVLTPGGFILERYLDAGNKFEKLVIKDYKGNPKETLDCGGTKQTTYDLKGDGTADDEIEIDCLDNEDVTITIGGDVITIKPEIISIVHKDDSTNTINNQGKVKKKTPIECRNMGWTVCKGFCYGIPLDSTDATFCCPSSISCDAKETSQLYSYLGVDTGTGTTISCTTEKQNPACKPQTEKTRVVNIFDSWNIIAVILILIIYYTFRKKSVKTHSKKEH